MLPSPISIAKNVIAQEIAGLNRLSEHLDDAFNGAVEAILTTRGRTIICGVGKSGIIGKKIAASFASTGTPSFFMHPTEAWHGDLGMCQPEDVVILISNSGQSEEVLKLLPFFQANGNTLIALSSQPNSTLSKHAHFHLNLGVDHEACPHNLAPTTSAIATLAMGDALTVALMSARDFQPNDFARFHPGGSLGARLHNRVRDVMEVHMPPVIDADSNFQTIVNAMTTGKLGLALVQLNQGYGLITDGDLRRAMAKEQQNVFSISATQIASLTPRNINANARLIDALDLMDRCKITSLLVEDNSQIIGIVKK
ncbi:KpsF/GutQ family sugar-phosphate isomerase [Vibrio scophthalmi]|uniref:Arabinose 5-phosphate isomerase n=1 Tax=Vibrio scophthalmi TaxID=45658 RepID=A0A1E3WF20_9VIBR|nr:KpsF/GutQ family sugar-phosphate isomerase [Vibrio scophthalmi]ODS04419.1 Arabinose-5-phosphate isomerase [Vibrio scophthalmi]